MKKVLILGDLHSGVRDGNIILMNHHLNYLTSIIQYCEDNNIDTILQTGDMMDVRTSLNTRVFREWKLRFFDVLLEKNIKLITIVGNHDMFYKQYITPNSPTEFLSDYPNISVVEKPTLYEPLDMLMVPWMCQENQDYIIELLETTTTKNIFGHFNIKGARIESGINTTGLSLEIFEKFDTVISGHFHIKSTYGNIIFVGSPYQSNWGDYSHERGFHTFTKKEMKFHKNDDDIFYQINYRDDMRQEPWIAMDLEGRNVKVVVEQREDMSKFERFIMELEDKKLVDLSVSEPYTNRNEKDSSLIVDDNPDLKVESTTDIMKSYVDEVYPEKRLPINNLMLRLYKQARNKIGGE